MDSLISLMSAIDLNSKLLPEGDYLKMCNYMKDIYKVVPRATSPEVFLPRVNVNAVRPLPESDSDSDDDDDYEMRPNEQLRQELHTTSLTMSRTSSEIKRIESRLKCLKIKQRITEQIRMDAVRERAQQIGVRIRIYTMEELRAHGHDVPNERNFYRSYMDRQNAITRDIMRDLQVQLPILNERMQTLTRRYNEVRSQLPL